MISEWYCIADFIVSIPVWFASSLAMRRPLRWRWKLTTRVWLVAVVVGIVSIPPMVWVYGITFNTPGASVVLLAMCILWLAARRHMPREQALAALAGRLRRGKW